MKYLLEEWSLKGGTLTQLEEALLHLDMKHVIPGKSLYIYMYFMNGLIDGLIRVNL